MSENELKPQLLLGKNAVDAAGLALIFGYHLRTVKINGLWSVPPARIHDEYNPKRWNVGVVNDIITEVWLPEKKEPAKTGK